MSYTRINNLNAVAVLDPTFVLALDPPFGTAGDTLQVPIATLFDATIFTTSIGLTSGDITATNGNIVIGTSGKGIDFSATAGTGTSELLDDYEEGTWTPTKSGFTEAGGGSYTLTGKYLKIGLSVYITGEIDCTGGATIASVGGATSIIGGLPFTSTTSINQTISFVNDYTIESYGQGSIPASDSILYPLAFAATSANHGFVFSGTYLTQ